MSEKQLCVVQQVVEGVLYYARTIDLIFLVSLSIIASEQSTAIEGTAQNLKQLIDYLAANLASVIRFHASDMVLNIHSDSSYLSETRTRNRVVGHCIMGSIPVKDQPIKMSGTVYVLCGIFDCVVVSATEAELGALFLNTKENKIL